MNAKILLVGANVFERITVSVREPFVTNSSLSSNFKIMLQIFETFVQNSPEFTN